jgi:uncharacterized protein
MRESKAAAGGEYICRFEYDSEITAELKAFAAKHAIKSAVFSIIGAATSARLAYYCQKTRVYREYDVGGESEIVACSGNICEKDGEPAVHAHICLSREDGSTAGGHLVSCRVFAAELHLRSFRGSITRKFDETTGLNLMNLEQVPEE